MQEKRSTPRGILRRGAGKKHPSLAEVSQMELSCVQIWPKIALTHNHTKSITRWQAVRCYARPNGARPKKDGPRRLRSILGWTHFHPFIPLPSCTSPLGDHSVTEEEEPRFSAFDVTTWPSRVWNEGIFGIFVDIRGAYNYWQQADDQAKLAFDCLVDWIGTLEEVRGLTDHFMNSGRNLLQEFRLQLMMASDPGIPLSKILACLYAAVPGEAGLPSQRCQPRGTARYAAFGAMSNVPHLWARRI
ncbi:retrotransposon hot spot (RHS) protein, putative [Trypanosoma cruzi marinkellei]|uniref:Retrotransposon hot spot (RHS) protein, putative n=1 Tax=Trypanosoma cruzi marinkellei TaxID=85056 RepID=K2MX21_TRYCR|nr:retrotransposon hot spot (RHS) protein, putative [Trypanosoma cruzi marinkellei]